MLKNFLILFNLFSTYLFKYLSLAQKDIDLDIDNMCYYLDRAYLDGSNNGDIYYVKPCEKNYYCRKINSNGHVFGTCEKYSPIVKRFNDNCKEDIECDTGLICKDNKYCSLIKDNDAYKVKGEDNNYYYYCPSDLIAIYESSKYICKSKEEEKKMVGKCYNKEEVENLPVEKAAFPDYLKVCGEESVAKIGSTNNYEKKSVTSNYIGSVDDGKFVEDITACKSGFALNFYGDKKTTLSAGETTGNQFKMCVTVNEVLPYDSNCFINYTLGENSYIYNAEKMVSSSDDLITKCDKIITKVEVFQQYLSKMEELKEFCENSTYYNEPFTCGKDELRKLWYYYNNIENYILYKNEEDVINYLIQDTYHLYGFEKDDENLKDFSIFLKINYFIYLLFLYFL